MNLRALIVLLLSFWIALACRALPPVQPASETSAAIGLRLRLSVKVLGVISSDQPPSTILFARVPAAGELTEAAALIPATFVRKDRFYLLNPAPGYKYCPVAARQLVSTAPTQASTGAPTANATKDSYTFFSESMIASLCVTDPAPGLLTFLGDFHLGRLRRPEKLDALQKHFIEVVSPGASTRLDKYFGPSFWFGDPTTTKVRGDAKSKRAFFEQARADFAKSAWQKLVVD